MQEQINTLIDTLSLDHKRGAAEIVHDSAELFKAIGVLAERSPMNAEHCFGRAVKRLAKGQPSMAPVINLLNLVCIIKERCNEDWERFTRDASAVEVRRDDLKELMEEQVLTMQPPETLITFSNSSTVAHMIATSFRQTGLPKKVFCGEGRPVMEGLVMAHKLVAAGLDVTLFTDAALMSRIVDADAVWVGGDSLSSAGLVNKVGSRALAMLARVQEIPFISLLGSDKLLAPGLMPFFSFLQQNPREIGLDETDTLNVHNQYYETVPLELVAKIVTDKGLFDPFDLVNNIAEESVSDLFVELVKS